MRKVMIIRGSGKGGKEKSEDGDIKTGEWEAEESEESESEEYDESENDENDENDTRYAMSETQWSVPDVRVIYFLLFTATSRYGPAEIHHGQP